jgi:hypothetical protein
LTVLDDAHAKMAASPDAEAARLSFYARLAEVELVLLLEHEAAGDVAVPKVFPLEAGPAVLAFDSEDRLAAFAGAVPYLALPGRRLATMLDGQGLSLGLNLGVAPSAILLPSEAVTWLAETVGVRPTQDEASIREISSPAGLPEALVKAIDGKLARAGGLASAAYLASVTYVGGAKSHVLAIIDATDGADVSLALEISEALQFSGLDAGQLDVMFVRSADPVVARLAKVGLQFELPQPPQKRDLTAPGSDPTSPPKLR